MTDRKETNHARHHRSAPRMVGRWSLGLATVVDTSKSAPRGPGAAMAVGPDGKVHGSVSGGCVEGAVYQVAREILADEALVLEHYGYSNDEAFAVGLPRGGQLDVFVERLDRDTSPHFAGMADDIRNGRPVAVAVVDHPDIAWRGRRMVLYPEGAESSTKGSLGCNRADDAVADDALGLLAAGHNTVLAYGPDGQRLGDGMKVLVQVVAEKGP